MTGAGTTVEGGRKATVLARLRRCRLGATAVEFAMVAPIFIVMAVGVFELGRAMWIKATMQYAVEETTRYAIVNTSASTSTLESYAQTKLTDTGMSASGITFSATADTTGGIDYMTVQATYNFTVLITLITMPAVTLTAKSRVPLE